MNKFEWVALSTFLTYWPEDIDYSTLIHRLKEEDFGQDENAIEVWYPFEGAEGRSIALFIDDLHCTLKNTFTI